MVKLVETVSVYRQGLVVKLVETVSVYNNQQVCRMKLWKDTKFTDVCSNSLRSRLWGGEEIGGEEEEEED